MEGFNFLHQLLILRLDLGFRFSELGDIAWKIFNDAADLLLPSLVPAFVLRSSCSLRFKGSSAVLS